MKIAIVYGQDNEESALEFIEVMSSANVNVEKISLERLHESKDPAKSTDFALSAIEESNLAIFLWSRLSPVGDMLGLSGWARGKRRYLGLICDEDCVPPYPLNLFANIPWHQHEIQQQMLPLLAFALKLNDVPFELNLAEKSLRKGSGKVARGRAFISHADSNAKDIEHLAMCLRECGYRYWGFRHSPREYKRGTFQEVQERIDDCAAVLVYLTPEWVSSDWCMKEYLYAKSIGKPLFLLRMEPLQPSLALAGETYVDFASDFAIGFTRLKEELDRILQA